MINNKVVMGTLVLLFVASFIPYTTSLVGDHFDNRLIEAVYGIVIIVMTIVNRHLHKIIDEPNFDQTELLKATRDYRAMLIPDIVIKVIGLLITIFFYAQ